MQVAPAKPFTQTWVSVALLIGAVIALIWAVFLLQFMNEPSAVGGSKAVLVTWLVISIATAVLAVAAAILLLRRDRPGRPVAWTASILMTLTCVGAIAGIPAIIGLFASRKAATP